MHKNIKDTIELGDVEAVFPQIRRQVLSCRNFEPFIRESTIMHPISGT
jgi:hypothetical protein